tara:strand:- start:49 stop:735 length:687 start_codon:yes stop_codon:yes gene_type:complete
MANKKELSKNQIGECIKLYTIDKWGMAKIAKHIGNISRGVIKRVLIENGIDIDTPGQRYRGGKKIARKRWVNKNKEKVVSYRKEWLEKNSEHRKNYMKEYRERNVNIIREQKRKYEKNRKDNDPFYKLCCYTRTAVYTCLKERSVDKYSNTFDILPYTLEELISHLENNFTEGMSWENYGEWHVDHIKPMASFTFDTIDDDSFNECWSLSNLQPLWAKDNLSKGSNII